MKFLKILFCDLNMSSRDRREISVVQEVGADVVVMAKMNDDSEVRGVGNIDLRRMSTRPLGKRVPNAINRIVSIFTWANYARKQKADIISGHDLPGVTVALLSTWFMRKSRRPLLVYDSHEFEIHREGRHSKLSKWFVCRWERFVMNRCEFSIIFSDIIVDELMQVHKLKKPPVAARNIPLYSHLDSAIIAQRRAELLSHFSIEPDKAFIIMYHGLIDTRRNIEQLIRLSSQVENAVLVIIGNSTEEYTAQLNELIAQVGLSGRAAVLPAVHWQELWQYTGAADVGTIILDAKGKSYYLCLPNKFFENVQSLTPLICSDYPAMRELINKYDIGLTVDPKNDAEIISAFERMRDDREMYARFKKNLLSAKEELCWEREKTALFEAYRSAFEKAAALHK